MPPSQAALTPAPGSLATATVGVVGARGYVGVELLELIGAHPLLRLAYASSRTADGEPISDHARVSTGVRTFEKLSLDEIAERNADIVVLALPDGAAKPYVEHLAALDTPPELIIDVSADHRFSDDWTYGLPELHRERLRGATRIANPGCYATAAQLTIHPLIGHLASTPHCFGVSGYSGAGRKHSERNDHRALQNGVLPYKLVNHTHEREITHHLGAAVRFSPHVAPFFRGITMTVQVELVEPTTTGDLTDLIEAAYADADLVRVIGEETPRVQQIAGRNGAIIGGVSVNPDRPTDAAVVCVIDNLRKGAASQVIQNINVARGIGETAGLIDLA